MSRSVERFITRMKLTELRRQREKLRSAYQQLADQAEAAGSPGERLRRLAEGLREIRFAQASLHEDVKHLPLLADAIEAGGVGDEVAALWLGQLETQLAAGRLRSEFVYAFGALLEEWSHEQAGSETESGPTEAAAERKRLLEFVLSDPPATKHNEVFDVVFAGLEDRLQKLPQKWEEVFGDWMTTWRPSGYAVERLERDVYQSARLRRDARRFGSGGEHFRDFADALALMGSTLPEWDWPEDGVPVEAVWTRNKWRLFPRPDLPTACLWQEVGEKWQGMLSEAIGGEDSVALRRRRLKKLRELGTPEVILQNEIRMLRKAEQQINIPTLEMVDPWDELGADAAAESQPSPIDDATDSSCIVNERESHQRMARQFRSAGGYGYGSTSWSVLLTHAEVQLARAAFPDRPVHVVKTDLRDFFPSLPHAVILDLLERLRLPERKLIETFLKIRLRLDDAATGQGTAAPTARAARGVPMGFGLSGFLGDLLLQFLERYVCLEASVRIVRQVDDITILSPTAEAALTAWQRLREFCAACGLEINEGKSGSVCIGPGETPPGLPGQPPSWGMLQLEPSGDWSVHQPTFEAHLAQSRERVLREESILSQVTQYNADAQFLLTSLAVTADLGDAHYQAVTAATRRFHQDFFGASGTFGTGQGIVRRLAETVRERFFGGVDGSDGSDGSRTPVPESWVHWPVTAGGLGLRNVVLEAAIHPRNVDKHFKPRQRTEIPGERPADWQLRENAWLDYYRSLMEEIEPLSPHETPPMKALVKDFIDRGKAVSGGRQSDLSPYWRWVLAVYGPEILARFGTFRFLITELVPLQLISGRLLQASSLGE